MSFGSVLSKNKDALGTGLTSLAGLFGPSDNADIHQLQNSGLDLLHSGEGLVRSSAAPITTGLNDLTQSSDFFRRLLGSREGEMNALSPQIASVLSQYDASRRMRGNLAPRGGGATAANEEAEFQKIGQLGGLLAQGRVNAAQGLEQGGTAIGQLGLNELNTGTNSLYNSGYLYDLAQRRNDQIEQQKGSAIGGAISSLLPLALGFIGI